MSTVPVATRQALTATLGAVVGVGLGMGALALVRAGQVEERDDAGTRAAFAKFLSDGPQNGRWRLETRDHKYTWTVQNDPSKPGMALVTNEDSLSKIPQQVSIDAVARRLAAGDAGLFLESYVPAGPPTIVGGERAISWRRRDCTACARRTFYLDMAGGFLTRIEDRDYRGDVVQTASLVERVATPASGAAPAPRPSAPRSADFRRWVSDQTIPVYEPTRLPGGFRMVGWGALDIDRKDGTARVRPLAISYGDGLARIEILIASVGDMETIDEVARQYQKSGPATCPATPASVAEEEVDGPHIKRRKDPCRTTLRREGLPHVVVVLVGFNEIPDHLYLETIQSLVLVPK